MNAPPAPWMQRPRIIRAPLGARPASTEPTAKIAVPSRLNADGAARVGQPSYRDQQDARHEQVGRLGPQSLGVAELQVGLPIAGRATATMLASNGVMNDPMDMIARAYQRRR